MFVGPRLIAALYLTALVAAACGADGAGDTAATDTTFNRDDDLEFANVDTGAPPGLTDAPIAAEPAPVAAVPRTTTQPRRTTPARTTITSAAPRTTINGNVSTAGTGTAERSMGTIAAAQAREVQPPRNLVVIEMIDQSATAYRFSRTRITVNPGDTLRFVQTGSNPHNVEFKKTPSGARLGTAMMGPFLLAKGQTYDLVIDKRFAPGVYEFVCTPHEMLGMKGTLIVTGE